MTVSKKSKNDRSYDVVERKKTEMKPSMLLQDFMQEDYDFMLYSKDENSKNIILQIS